VEECSSAMALLSAIAFCIDMAREAGGTQMKRADECERSQSLDEERLLYIYTQREKGKKERERERERAIKREREREREKERESEREREVGKEGGR